MNYEEEFAPDPLSPTSEAAVGYRKLGIQVVPCSNKTKVPVIKWRHLANNLMSDLEFDALFGPRGQFANHDGIGMLTGKASGRVLMIDLDLYKGDSALQWWRGLMAVHNNGCDLETAEQITGGGGRQMFFTYPEGWVGPGNQKTSLNVDIRERGGFAVLPPTMHLSGRRYVWKEGFSPAEAGMMQAPPWLLEAVLKLCREHSHAKTNGHKHEGTEQAHAAGQDGFGHQTDGREDLMYRLVWAAIVDWYRESPNKPDEQTSRVKATEKYRIYEAQVAPQKTYDPDVSKWEALEAENRGSTAFWIKWAHAMEQWHGKVAEEAAKPGPKSNNDNNNDNDNGFAEDTRQRQKERVDPEGKPSPIAWLDMSSWDAFPAPDRLWAIRNLVPLNQVGLFSGEGGGGKSIIELMKNVATVAGKDWMGHLPEQGGAFYLGAEDEADEIHRRLEAIAKWYKVTFADLAKGGLRVLPLLGQDSMLCVPSGLRGNHIEVTPLYKQLLEAAGDLKPKNISIDTLSRAFGGDEINRVQVYAFAMHMQAVAQASQGSVTILSHPSLAGMASGSGISGSTAWHGAFRFRQYLKGIKADEDADPGEDDLRELEFKKNQYGPRGRPIVLKWKDGLFLPVNGATDPERAARESKADGMFINLLRKFLARGESVTHAPTSPNRYAPKLFCQETEAKAGGFRERELDEAMRRHLDSGRIIIGRQKVNGRDQLSLELAPGS